MYWVLRTFVSKDATLFWRLKQSETSCRMSVAKKGYIQSDLYQNSYELCTVFVVADFEVFRGIW